jgi:hypothetical protein
MDKQEIKKRAVRINKIYDEYMAKIKSLQKEKNRMINEFIKKVEEEKVKEIREEINSQKYDK